jgi:hypothetical protein
MLKRPTHGLPIQHTSPYSESTIALNYGFHHPRLKQLLFSHKVNIPWDAGTKKWRVDVIKMVGHYNQGACSGDILFALDSPPGQCQKQHFHSSGGGRIEQSHLSASTMPAIRASTRPTSRLSVPTISASAEEAERHIFKSASTKTTATTLGLNISATYEQIQILNYILPIVVAQTSTPSSQHNNNKKRYPC